MYFIRNLFILFILILLGDIAYSIFSCVFTRRKMMKGIRITNGQISGVDTSCADSTQLRFPLKKYTSINGELMLCFIILCIEEISKIYAFFHNRLPIGFDIYDSLVTVEKKTINEFCVIHIALLLILLWSVFIIANNLFHTPNIQFDREGCLINSKKAEESILFRAGFLLIINATFIGVMGYILYIVYHILNIDIYAPITFLILFIVIDIFAVSVMKNKKNISFVSRVLEFLPTFPTSFHRIKDKRIPEENIVSGIFKWEEIWRIEYLVINSYRIVSTASGKENLLYNHFLKIVLKDKEKNTICIPLHKSFTICQRSFFSKQHDHRIFLPLATLCKAHGVKFLCSAIRI